MNFISCLIILLLSIFSWNIYKYNYNSGILDFDNISCVSQDGESYIYQIKNVKLLPNSNLKNKQPDWIIHTNLLFGFMIECNNHKSKYIKKNIKKIFHNVMEKEKLVLDTNYSIYETKPYIALLKKISDI